MAKRVIKRKAEDPGAFILMVISAVLILICGISVYSSLSDKGAKLEDLKSARKETDDNLTQLKDEEGKLLKLSSMVGWNAGKDYTRPGQPREWVSYNDLKDFMLFWSEKLAAVYKVDKYKPDAQGKLSLNIPSLFSETERLAAENIKKAEELGTTEKASWDEINKIVGTKEETGAIAKMIEAKNAEAANVLREIVALDERIAKTVQDGERETGHLRDMINQTKDEMVKTSRENENKISELEKEKRKYAERLEKLRLRLELIKEGVEIDGQVILADVANNYVYIDLGASDAILKGMEFEIFSVQQGGLPQNKGKVQITKIHEIYSQAIIMEGTMDARHPIISGDFINSKTYSREKAKIFVFAGTSVGRYSFAELQRKIEEFGGKVLAEITPEITYVVIGNNYEADENYQKAIHLGAIALREKELYSLLNLDWRE
ncbi:MAG: BRCT domain-containing protein [Planctomycetes bacterium]|nr:BRCT domain-containing protein [Planctomycetota bacterium]